MMLVVIPAVAFGLIFSCISRSPFFSRDHQLDWRGKLLLSAILWGVTVVILTEGLSLFRVINRLSLAIGWSLAGLIFLFFSLRSGSDRKIADRQDAGKFNLSSGLIPFAGMAALAGLLFFIAVRSPSNTIDSLQYHMPRVMHWTQNRSLAFYPVYYEPQLFNPIYAEVVILNLGILAGSDWPANLVQWAGMAGTILGVTQIVRMLGGSRRAELLAAAFVFSIPMGILQSTSTQTDYVTAFWFICTLFLVLVSARRELSWQETLFLGSVIGLGCLTKMMYYFFAFPALVWFVFLLWRRSGFKRVLERGLLITAVVVTMNAGYWIRNFNTYAFPIGPTALIENHSTQQRTAGGVMLNVLEHLGYNFSTQRSDVNQAVQTLVNTAAGWAGEENRDFAVSYAWNHEDLAGNPIHYGLFFLTIGLVILTGRKPERSIPEKQLTLVMLGSIILFTLLLRSYPYVTRHHLTFLAGWGIIFGLTMDRVFPGWLTFLGTILLIYASSRHVLYNRSRPLIGDYPVTSSDSILLEEPRIILFSNLTAEREPYYSGTAAVLETGCDQVGMMIDSHDPEYALWWLLEAPRSGIRLEHIYYPEHLEAFVDPEFDPCIIVCTICSESREFEGYVPYKAFDFFRIFIDTDFQQESVEAGDD